jgi:uncharacterized repeat protein (TIGR01451 family)
LDQVQASGDVCSNHFTPCTTPTTCPVGGSGFYFVNGFDLVRAMLARDRSTQTLFLGLRVAGVIGDTDGDGNPNGARGPGCQAGDNIQDQPGIGSFETYEMYIDTNCDGNADIVVNVSGSQASPQVSVVDAFGDPISGAQGTAAYAGSDLEVRIDGLALPRVLTFSGDVRCNSDGLTDDGFAPLTCSPPNLGIEVASFASPDSLCAGATVDITLEIHNTSTAPLTDATVNDHLPDGLSYVANTTSGSCGAPEPAVAGQQLSWDIGTLAEDQSCTITFTAVRSGDCFGTATNHAEASALFQEECYQRRSSRSVGPASDDLDLSCESCVAAVATATASGVDLLAAPNPFSGSLNYTYRVPQGPSRSVQIGAYDMTGRLIHTLVLDRQASGTVLGSLERGHRTSGRVLPESPHRKRHPRQSSDPAPEVGATAVARNSNSRSNRGFVCPLARSSTGLTILPERSGTSR